jgi:hypothetical protein
MAPASATATANGSSTRVRGTVLIWRPTKIMNMSDLSKDDDFLSHLLVEKLGTGAVPLLVHKMDPSRRLPKTNAEDLMQIVRRVSIPLARFVCTQLIIPWTRVWCHTSSCHSWLQVSSVLRMLSDKPWTTSLRSSNFSVLYMFARHSGTIII